VVSFLLKPVPCKVMAEYSFEPMHRTSKAHALYIEDILPILDLYTADLVGHFN
jgi:hypothetical protein